MADNKKEIEEGLKSIAKSSLIVFIGIFLAKLFTYLYRITIARHFGPEVYGIFSLAIMILGFCVAFASIGLQDGLLRFIPFYRGKKQEYNIQYIIRISLIFTIITSIFFAIILFIFADWISITLFKTEGLTPFLRIFSFLVPIIVLSNIFLNILKAFEKINIFSFISNILQGGFKIILLISLIFFGYNIDSVRFSYFLTFTLILVISYIFYKIHINKIFKKNKLNKKNKSKICRELFSYSWPIMFSGIISSIFLWTDSFCIGYFMNVTEVGIYNSAVPIVSIMFILPAIFTQLFFPLIIREFSNKKYQVIEELSKQVSKWIFIFNLPLFIMMFLFPGAFINLFFGDEYLFAADALRILSIGGLIASVSLLSTYLISMIGKSKIILTNLIVVSLINILLNIILIPKLGIVGAAISTSTVWGILNIILLIEVKYFIKIIPLRRKMLKILLISLLPLTILIIIKNTFVINFIGLILLGICFMLIYLLLILILGGLDQNDFLILNTVKDKIFKK